MLLTGIGLLGRAEGHAGVGQGGPNVATEDSKGGRV